MNIQHRILHPSGYHTRPEPLEARLVLTTFLVTTLQDISDAQHDTGSLRDAIYLANSAGGADEIDFLHVVGGHLGLVPLTGTIKLGSDLPAIHDDLNIFGPVIGKPGKLTINGNQHAIFTILAHPGAIGTPVDVTMTDLTVTHGQSLNGGGINVDDINGDVVLADCAITGNHALSTGVGGDVHGGGIYVKTGHLTLITTKVSGNSALGSNGDATRDGGSGYGGGIYCLDTLTIEGASVISGNTARGGNAGTAISGNGHHGGDAHGGGIEMMGGNATIDASLISGNKALAGRGGNGAKGAAGVNGAPGANGTNGGAGGTGGTGGGANGGGIDCYNSNLDITYSTISGNTALEGQGGTGGAGGKGGKGGVATNSSHAGAGGNGGAGGNSGGNGGAYGGGVETYISAQASGTLSIRNSTISGNSVPLSKIGAHGAGGDPGAGQYTLNHVTHHGSKGAKGQSFFGDVDQDGGGLWTGGNGNLTGTLSQVTIAKNACAFSGGGVEIRGGTIDIHNSTIAQNKDGENGGGGGLSIGNATVNVISSIIAGNFAPSEHSKDVDGKINATNDLIQDGDVSYGTDINNLKNINPLLRKLGLHGGTTATMLPSIHSPVIDKGSDPDNIIGRDNTDQRGFGFPRKLGAAIDIGSVEVG